MSFVEILQLGRVVAVILLVGGAAVLATPPNKVPLALRGLARILRRDRLSSETAQADSALVPVWEKAVAFLMVALAFVLAKI